MLQLMIQNDLDATEAQYFDMIEGKTAALFAAASELGAVVAERPAVECAALRAYGAALGMAFQLIDDALDYAADEKALGKTVGDDFREGKITLPVMVAFARGDAAEQAFWRRTIEERAQEEADLAHAQALMARHGAVEETVARAEAYGERARTALDVFPDSEARQVLLGIVDFCIARAR